MIVKKRKQICNVLQAELSPILLSDIWKLQHMWIKGSILSVDKTLADYLLSIKLPLMYRIGRQW